MVDDKGRGIPFNLRDEFGVHPRPDSPGLQQGKGLEEVPRRIPRSRSGSRAACAVHLVGRDLGSSLPGLLGAIDRFQSPLVNAYAADLIFEEVLEKSLLVYVLPNSSMLPRRALR